jgi:hypothetical protein
VWTEQQKLTPSDGVSGEFGYAVALNGRTAVVGDPYQANTTGAAYVYTSSGTVWTEQAKLTAPDGFSGDYFGISVALSGDTTLVGATAGILYTPGAYVYLATTANLTLSPSTGSPFTTLTLTGSGFSPGESIGFSYFSSGKIRLAAAVADSGGAFATTARLRLTPYGSGLVRAVGQSSGLYGAANFAVTPGLIMSPSAGSVGTTALAQGFGFGAGEQVDVYRYTAPRQLLGTATADSTGSFYLATGLTFMIPAGAATGINLVVGKGQTTQAVAKGYVTVAVIYDAVKSEFQVLTPSYVIPLSGAIAPGLAVASEMQRRDLRHSKIPAILASRRCSVEQTTQVMGKGHVTER